MALMPIDIIMKHLSQAREAQEKGGSEKVVSDIAIAIDRELKGNFLIVSKSDPFAPDVEAAAAEERRIAPDPLPQAKLWVDGDATDITIRATGNPMLWYIGTDHTATRLDEMTPGDRFPLRERQIALALTDLSANALKDQTL